MRRLKCWGVASTLIVLLATVFLAPGVRAAPARQGFPSGTVFALRGTPHIWIAGPDGVLHWAGDTRALGSQPVNWGTRQEVSLDQLQHYHRGDPYLHAGLVKIGDPIYLAKWESEQPVPTLLHIRSIHDVELFGIDTHNYGRFVLDRHAWEQKFGFNTDALPKGELAPAAAPTATPAATPVPVRLAAREIRRHRNSDTEYEVGIEVSGAQPGTRLKVSAAFEEWLCFPACTDTRRGKWGPRDAGPVDSHGRVQWTDKHGPYKGVTYAFEDDHGHRTTIGFGDDLPPRPAATATPVPALAFGQVSRRRLGDRQYEVTVEVLGATPHAVIGVDARYEEWVCTRDGCAATRHGEWGTYPAGTADANGRLLWTGEHGPYKDYTYTFRDSQSGATGVVHFTDDLPLG
jgi:hypothetical protein